MLYTSMCDKVNEVEEALEDVREMMMKGALKEDEGDESWKREFSAVVQDVVKHDAGWKYVPLFFFYQLQTVFVSDFLLSYI